MRVATGEIQINLNDEAALAGIRRVENQVHRSMRKIDAERADAEVGIDLKKFKKDLAEAKAILKAFDKQRAVITAQLEDKKLTAHRRKQLVEELAVMNRQLQAQIQIVEQKAQIVKGLDAQLSRQKQLTAEEQRQLKAEGESLKLAEAKRRADEKALTFESKRRLEAFKLQKAYKAAQDSLKRMNREVQVGVDAHLNKQVVIAEMLALKAELEAIGAEPVEVKTKLDSSLFGKVGAAAFGKFAQNAGRLGEISARLGPFTTNLRTWAFLLLPLGPLITGLIGSTTALTGVIASGLVGAMAAGSAGILGFGQAITATTLIVKPFIEQIGQARKASEAYDKAVREHGKDSEKAAKKLAILNSVLGHISPQARKQFVLLGQLGDRWRKLTADARPQVFMAVGAAIQTISDRMGSFAKRGVEAVTEVSRGWRAWMRGLQSGEAGQILDTTFRRANEAIRPLMDGLGALATWFGRIAESASRFLKPIADGFRDWAQGLADGVANGDRLDAAIDRIMGHAKSAGRLVVSTFNLLGAVLGAGADQGQNFAESISNVFDRWTKWLRAPENRGAVQDFFREAIDATTTFAKFVAKSIEIFFRISQAIAPAVDAIAKFALNIFKVGDAFANLVSVGPSIASLATTIAGIWSIAKIGAFLAMLQRVVGGFMAIRAAAGTAAAAMSLFGIGKFGSALAAGTAGTAAAAGAAAQNAKQMSLFKTAAAGAAGSAATLSRAALLARFGLAGLAAAVVYLGVKLLKGKSDAEAFRERLEAIDRTSANLTDNAARLRELGDAAKPLADNAEKSGKSLASLEAQLAKLPEGTAKWKAKLDEVNRAIQADIAAQAKQQKNLLQTIAASGQVVAATTNRLAASNALKRALQDEADQEALIADRKRAGLLIEPAITQELQRRQAATRAATATLDRANLSMINATRQAKGFTVNIDQSAQALTRLARTRPATAQAIGLQFPDPRQANRAAAAASRAIGAGVKQTVVMKIIADSRTAEQAIARLNQATVKQKVMRIVEQGGDKAINVLQAIAGRKLTPKESRVVEKGGPAAIAVLNKIIGTKIGDKRFAAIARDAASGVISRVLGMIAQMPASRTTHLRTILETIRIESVRRRGGGRPDAAGGYGQAGFKPGLRRSNAMIGEGGGPEWRYDMATGAAEKVWGPQLVNLRRSEAVIPTEQTYRGRGREILKDIAKDLGLRMYQAGKRAKPKLKVPSVYEAGATPIEPVRDATNESRELYQKRKKRVHNLNKDISEERQKLAKEKDVKKRRKINDKIKKLREDRDKYRDGAGELSSLKQLESRWKTWRERLQQMNEYKRQIDSIETQINTERSYMAAASARGDVAAWKQHQARRQGLLTAIRDKKAQAFSLAREGTQFKGTLGAELAAAEAEVAEGAVEKGPEVATAEALPVLSIEEYIENIGRTAEHNRLLLDRLHAEIDTPGDVNDDRAAQRALVAFYESIYGPVRSQVQRLGLPRDIALEKDLGATLLGARSELRGLEQPTADEQAINEQLRTRLKIAEDERTVANAFAAVAGGPGDIGTGGYYSARQAAGAGPNIYISTLHPADPATLAAIGSAATAGMGYQGSRPAPRSWSGY